MPTTRRHHALTLVELMICLIFVTLGYVGVARAISHSMRIGERGQVRSVLTAVAQAELDHLRTIAPERAEYVRLVPASRMRVHVTSHPGPDGLLAYAVEAEALGTAPPFIVELTGWVVAP